jgi:peptidoglycan/LPS O-acetylase OafA/YrhL
VQSDRFAALDGWRGIAACMVALFHVRANGHISELELVKNAHLFVDYFFVLSGFVIAATYEERLARGFGIWRFMLLRFGRLYPLHIAVLFAFIAFDLVRGQSQTENLFSALLPRILLLHGLGMFETRLWNIPSWTVSTEFLAYLAFAAVVVALKGRNVLVFLAAVLLCPVVLHLQARDDATGYEMVRCLYGFSAGVLTWHVFRRFRRVMPAGTLAELGAAAAVLLFASALGRTAWAIASPAVFAAAVLIFASQRGIAARVLASKPFLFVGTVSYSIYMVHFFVGARLGDALRLGKAAGVRAVDFLGAEKWAGDVLTMVYLALVVLISSLTYRFIEAPARNWFRGRAPVAPADVLPDAVPPAVERS